MKNTILIFLLLPFLSSCEKAFFGKDEASTNPRTNFEYLWEQCDQKYSYFELKQLDWNQVYSDYSARITNDMSEVELFKVLGEMVSELKDDHSNLISNFDVSQYNLPGQRPDNFDWRIVVDNYLSPDLFNSGPYTHDFIANGEVGYIRFPSFTGGTNTTNLDFALDRYQNTRGLILDLRENGGGAASDVFALISRFIETRTLVNYSRIKNGPGHDDFSEDEPVYVDPHTGTQYLGKVMVLIDRGTYSAGSFTSLATKAIPNLVLVGDTTGGGLGLPNGGQLPNGWQYRFSITQALTLDKDNSYENGVPPDIFMRVDWNDRTKDEVIERALAEIL